MLVLAECVVETNIHGAESIYDQSPPKLPSASFLKSSGSSAMITDQMQTLSNLSHIFFLQQISVTHRKPRLMGQITLLAKIFHSVQNLIEDDRRAVPDAGLDFTAEIAIVMLTIFTDQSMDMSTFTDLHMDISTFTDLDMSWICQGLLISTWISQL